MASQRLTALTLAMATIAAFLAGLVASAPAQTVTFATGSIHDLDPPAPQSTGPEGQVFEQIVSSRAAHRMQEVRDLGRGDILRKLARPVGRLSIGLPGEKLAFCTASLIADDLVLTNHHCIPGLGTQGAVTEAMLWMGYLSPASLEGVAQYPVDLTPVETDKTLDYAILKVRGRPGSLWGKVTLSTSEPEAGGTLFIVHHPAGATQHITRGGCQAGDPATIGDDIRHVCDTLGGSSGAPIFDNNTRAVIGLHNRAAGPGVNAGKRIASLAERSAVIAGLVQREGGGGAPAPAVPQAPAQPPLSPAALEWQAVQATTSCAVLESYLGAHGSSPFARYATARQKELRCGEVAVGTFPEAPTPAPIPSNQCSGVMTQVVGKGRVCLDPDDAARREFQDCRGGQCGPQMVVVPAGSFMMGSPESEEERRDDERPQRRVTIAQPFAVGRFEVTRGAYDRFVKATGHDVGASCVTLNDGKWEDTSGKSYRDTGYAQTDAHPAACVSWNDAKAYIDWLNRQLGLTGDAAYRLLSEAEWEYAARAGTTTRFSFGDKVADLCAHGNGADETKLPNGSSWTNKAPCSDGHWATAPVGKFALNPWGLSDMHGNVWEWIEDPWHVSYADAPTDGSVRTKDVDTILRVVRGGSWSSAPGDLRSAGRNRYGPGIRFNGFGFRVARSLSR